LKRDPNFQTFIYQLREIINSSVFIIIDINISIIIQIKECTGEI